MMIYFLFCNFCLLFISYWSTASEQWFARFRWMAKRLNRAYIRVHSPLNSPSIQAKQSSRSYTVGPCWLSITSSSTFSRKSLISPNEIKILFLFVISSAFTNFTSLRSVKLGCASVKKRLNSFVLLSAFTNFAVWIDGHSSRHLHAERLMCFYLRLACHGAGCALV